MKKKLLLLFVALLLVMSFALVSCGGEEEGPTTPDVGDQNNQVVEDPTLQSFTGLTFESVTVDYDGTEHILEIVGTLPEGASVSYTSNKATDAGVYNAVAIVSCEGYNTKTLNATLTINKINYDMSSAAWSSVTTFTYDTTAKSVTLTGLPVGVTVKSYSGNQATDVGSYTASATLNYDAKNYNEPTVPTCSWSISKAQITANVELPGASYEYDTQMHSLAIVGNIPAGTTVAYTYNGNTDGRAIFDVNIRMLMHITNSFQLDHGTEIDSPMTPQDKDTILNYEKQKLDTLTGIGALIGTPSVEFVESANPESDMMNGDFVWDFSATPTPPFKSGTARVSYTDEGFAAFFGAE